MEQYITLVWHSPVKMSVPTTGTIYNKILSQAQLYMYDVKMWEHCNFMPSKLPQFFFFNFHCYQGIHSGDMIRTLLQCSFHTVQMAYEQKKKCNEYVQTKCMLVCWNTQCFDIFYLTVQCSPHLNEHDIFMSCILSVKLSPEIPFFGVCV